MSYLKKNNWEKKKCEILLTRPEVYLFYNILDVPSTGVLTHNFELKLLLF